MDSIENSQIPQPTQPVQQVPAELKKKSNLPTIIILLIAVLLVGVGGVYAGMQLSKKQTPVVLPTAPPQEIRPTEALPTSISDETANWKTYTNTDFKYQIKYPPQWNLIYTGNGLEMSNLSSIREFKEVYPLHDLAITGGLSFDTMKENTRSWVWANTPKSENTTINGNKAWSIEGLMKWTDNKTYWRKYILIQFQSNDTTIELSWFDTTDQEDKKIFDQMLSTFEFTN